MDAQLNNKEQKHSLKLQLFGDIKLRIHSMGTNPQNLLPPDFGTFGEEKKKFMFIFKEVITIFDQELHFPQIHHQLGLMLLFRNLQHAQLHQVKKDSLLKQSFSPLGLRRRFIFLKHLHIIYNCVFLKREDRQRTL